MLEREKSHSVQIVEIETSIRGADFDHFRSTTNCNSTREFLGVLLKSNIFRSEIRKREKQEQESFHPPVHGWRVPWKQEFTKNGELSWEWGFIFRFEGPDTKPFATCLVYTYSGESAKVLELEYLGNDRGLPTVEESKMLLSEL